MNDEDNASLETLELVQLYESMLADKTGHRQVIINRKQGEADHRWYHFEKMRNCLYFYELWELRKVFMEAQFKYASKAVGYPPLNTLYGNSAFRKFKFHYSRKSKVNTNKDVIDGAVAGNKTGPYKDGFAQSAYNLRMHLNTFDERITIYRHFNEQYSGYFIASDPEAYDVLLDKSDAFGEDTREAFEQLRGDRALQEALRALWRVECQEQKIIKATDSMGTLTTSRRST